MERYLQSVLGSSSFEGVSAKRSAAMRAVRSKGNKSTELRLRMALIRAGISGWTLHEKSLPGKPDFFFTKLRLAIFVDGCFWHGCPKCGHTPATRSAFWAAKFERNRARDLRNRLMLRKRRVSVIRLWEHQLKSSKNLSRAVERIIIRCPATGN